MTRFRIVVVDGLDWEWVSSHREEAAPFWEMADGGCWGRMEVADPPLTAPAAAMLLTGRNPLKGWQAGGDYASCLDLLRASPWYDALARYQHTALVVNVPATSPALVMPSGGAMVGGFPSTPGMMRAWPPNLDLRGYPTSGADLDSQQPGGRREVERILEEEAQIVEWVLRQPRREVEVVWLRATDSAGHHVWGEPLYGEVVTRTLKAAQRLSEGVTEGFLLLSDHGFDALSSHRCERYRASTHGPVAGRAGLKGGHTPDAVFLGRGPGIKARGELEGLRLLDVVPGMFATLRIVAPSQLEGRVPAWVQAYTPEEAAAVQRQLQNLGYVE